MVSGGLEPRLFTRFSPLGLNSCLILHWSCCLVLCQAFPYCFSWVFCLCVCVVWLVFVCVGAFLCVWLPRCCAVFGWLAVCVVLGVCVGCWLADCACLSCLCRGVLSVLAVSCVCVVVAVFAFPFGVLREDVLREDDGLRCDIGTDCGCGGERANHAQGVSESRREGADVRLTRRAICVRCGRAPGMMVRDIDRLFF